MGKRNKRFEEEVKFGRCELCGNEIGIEFYYDKGDIIFCNECSAEYKLKSRHPLHIELVDADYDDNDYDDFYEEIDPSFYKDLDFD